MPLVKPYCILVAARTMPTHVYKDVAPLVSVEAFGAGYTRVVTTCVCVYACVCMRVCVYVCVTFMRGHARATY